jgi:hypothetical protein
VAEQTLSNPAHVDTGDFAGVEACALMTNVPKDETAVKILPVQVLTEQPHHFPELRAETIEVLIVLLQQLG